MEIKEIIEIIKRKMDVAGGLKAVYFVACGGSLAAIYSAKFLIQSEARNIATAIYSSNEFNYAMPESLDNRCICISCSLKATEETVRAVEKANEAGAVTIAMTGMSDTLMAKTGQYVVTYSNGDEQVYSQANQAKALKLGFEILYQFEGYKDYDKAMAAYSQIDEIVAGAKKSMLPSMQKFAREFKDDEVFYVLASGALSGTGYTMSCCHLMEMQCRHAVFLHSGEYFHGPFETTDKEVAMVLLKSVGRTRFLDERAERFLKKYADHYIVIDADQAGVSKIDPAVAEYFNSVVMVPLERYFVYQMSLIRNRSMDDRRYMWKVEY
jgi:fructoselysine 6-phosphate deglycase